MPADRLLTKIDKRSTITLESTALQDCSIYCGGGRGTKKTWPNNVSTVVKGCICYQELKKKSCEAFRSFAASERRRSAAAAAPRPTETDCRSVLRVGSVCIHWSTVGTGDVLSQHFVTTKYQSPRSQDSFCCLYRLVSTVKPTGNAASCAHCFQRKASNVM